MDPASYLDHIRADGMALVAAGRSAPRAPVPSCPDWDMTALVIHASTVHHWVTEIITTRATERIRNRPKPDKPDDPDAVMAWYDDGLSGLLDVLGRTDPDEPVWNWFDGKPAPARFWVRRMAQETAVHRWDAEAAAAIPEPIDAELAVDGIDEFLEFVAVQLPGRPIDGLSGSLHLHTTDADGEWLLSLAPDHLGHRREHAKADAAVRGGASDLFLWSVGRLPADSPGLQVFGDRGIVDAWKSVTF